MAEALDAMTVICGGLTTLGVLLDWGVVPETKQRLQTKLESMLYWFRYTTPRTFGREEIEFSMRFFRPVGDRFWSVRRWTAVLLIYDALTIVCALTPTTLPGASSAAQLMTLIHSFTSALLFSASISYTIWISNLLLRTKFGVSIAGTALLILLHLILLILWRPVVSAMTDTVPLSFDASFPLLTMWSARPAGDHGCRTLAFP